MLVHMAISVVVLIPLCYYQLLAGMQLALLPLKGKATEADDERAEHILLVPVRFFCLAFAIEWHLYSPILPECCDFLYSRLTLHRALSLPL